MGIAHHYEPCFASVPQSPANRWTLIREFISRWHNLNLPLLRDPERSAQECEYALNRTLPDSIREWIALSNDLISLDSFQKVFRDLFDVSRMNRFSSTTLMLQCEGDVYWTVHDKNAVLPDPPVDSIHRDFDTDQWTKGWNESKSLTSFVLGHMAYFLGLGFVRTKDIDDSVVEEMDDAFPIAVDFDGLRVFEMTDLISFVRKRSNDDYTLIVARKDSLPESALPRCIRRLIPS
jgi:hypothetical protein